jgi:hypothetical protein
MTRDGSEGVVLADVLADLRQCVRAAKRNADDDRTFIGACDELLEACDLLEYGVDKLVAFQTRYNELKGFVK